MCRSQNPRGVPAHPGLPGACPVATRRSLGQSLCGLGSGSSSHCDLPSRAPVRAAALQPGSAHAVGQCSHLPQEQQRWENKGLKLAIILVCECRRGMASPVTMLGLVQLVFGSPSSSLCCMVVALQWEAARFLLCHPGQAASDPSRLGAGDPLLTTAGPPQPGGTSGLCAAPSAGAEPLE